jgi:dimeric dUTPase (all-alpha-NTP-PPase superfamily)
MLMALQEHTKECVMFQRITTFWMLQMSINVEKTLEEYREIIQYLDGMRFPDGATKAVRTRITHKNINYLMIGSQFYF